LQLPGLGSSRSFATSTPSTFDAKDAWGHGAQLHHVALAGIKCCESYDYPLREPYKISYHHIPPWENGTCIFKSTCGMGDVSSLHKPNVSIYAAN